MTWRKRLMWAIRVALVAAGFVLGALWRGQRLPDAHRHEATSEAPAPTGSGASQAAEWTCSMHPQIRQPKPGKCPICAMDLIPLAAGGGGDLGPRTLTLSPAARKLAGVEVAPAERRPVTVSVRLVGKVQYDETRLATITARVPGRLDRLYADYTGTPVKTGEHLAELYSPELVSAQEELLQTLKAAGSTDAALSTALAETVKATLEASREKLRLWGLTPAQIGSIETSGKALDHLTFYSPLTGIVISKEAVEGDYVETGTRIYTVADLSQLWVSLSAYESDLTFIRYGQEVRFAAEAWPGSVFTGRISFISPTLDAMTRTVPVRVNVANPDGRLRPEMFVRAEVRARLDARGEVVRPDLTGKWVCPMHPEVVKTESAACDRCGMALVRAEDLGYAGAAEVGGDPLTIPATAPLVTGRRAVVYVAVPGAEGVFEGREVTLGPRAGDAYVVLDGLSAGDQVVVAGAFRIDSSLQIQGRPSMMLPDAARDAAVGVSAASGVGTAPAAPAAASGPEVAIRDVPAAFRDQLSAVVEAVFVIGSALAGDSLPKATAAAAAVAQALTAVDMTALNGPPHAEWMRQRARLEDAVQQLSTAADIAVARRHFETVSTLGATLVQTFGVRSGMAIYRVHCPMAFDNRGADWLQPDREVRNPYFGAAMLSCGEITATLAAPTESAAPAGGHRHE